jgi:hypothetical protein
VGDHRGRRPSGRHRRTSPGSGPADAGRGQPQLEPFDQEVLAVQRHYLDLDPDAELARLEQLRSQHLAVLDTLDATDWERPGRHGEHGELTLELYETHMAAEEVDHLAQIARLL